MLIFGEKLIDTPILSLQTGAELARTKDAIIDPATLNILAYSVSGKLLVDQTQTNYIRTNEIREYSRHGLIVNSTDEIIIYEDVISKKEIYDLMFDPIGLRVSDEDGRRLGRIVGYTVNIPTYSILQLRITKTGIARLTSTDMLVHRSQITKINSNSIVVKSTSTKLKDVTPIINTDPIINPFRATPPTQEAPSSLSSDSTS